MHNKCFLKCMLGLNYKFFLAKSATPLQNKIIEWVSPYLHIGRKSEFLEDYLAYAGYVYLCAMLAEAVK